MGSQPSAGDPTTSPQGDNEAGRVTPLDPVAGKRVHRRGFYHQRDQENTDLNKAKYGRLMGRLLRALNTPACHVNHQEKLERGIS